MVIASHHTSLHPPVIASALASPQLGLPALILRVERVILRFLFLPRYTFVGICHKGLPQATSHVGFKPCQILWVISHMVQFIERDTTFMIEPQSYNLSNWDASRVSLAAG